MRSESAEQDEPVAEGGAGSWLRVEPRPIPLARGLRTGLRTLHLLAVAALYGGHLYGMPAERLEPALLWTLATGGTFMALEIYQASIWLAQVRGVASLLKVGLLGCVGLAWELRVPLLTLVLVIGAVSSHMPAGWRYYSLLHGRVAGPTDKG
jgi:hypothetical protein